MFPKVRTRLECVAHNEAQKYTNYRAKLSLHLKQKLMAPFTFFWPKCAALNTLYDSLKKTVETIQKSAKTDKIGDGKIFVSNIEEAIRIRTGEKGRHAV